MEECTYLDEARPPHAIQPPKHKILLHVMLQVRQTRYFFNCVEVDLSGGRVVFGIHHSND